MDNGDRGSVVGKTVVGKTGMSNHWGVDGVGNNRGVNGVGNGGSSGIMGLSLIGHISDIAIIVIGVVLDMLDPAIGKSDRVGSLSVASTVRGLRGLEVGLGVVISHSIGVGVGGGLSEVGGSVAGNGMDDGGRGVLGSSRGDGHKGKGGEGLKRQYV